MNTNTNTATDKPAKTPRVICPKLVDIVTGASRVTNRNYLNDKAERLGVTVDELVANYVSKSTLALLRGGDRLGLSKAQVETILRLNGKTPKVKAEKAPKADAVAA